MSKSKNVKSICVLWLKVCQKSSQIYQSIVRCIKEVALNSSTYDLAFLLFSFLLGWNLFYNISIYLVLIPVIMAYLIITLKCFQFNENNFVEFVEKALNMSEKRQKQFSGAATIGGLLLLSGWKKTMTGLSFLWVFKQLKYLRRSSKNDKNGIDSAQQHPRTDSGLINNFNADKNTQSGSASKSTNDGTKRRTTRNNGRENTKPSVNRKLFSD